MKIEDGHGSVLRDRAAPAEAISAEGLPSRSLISDDVYDLIRAAILDGSQPAESRLVESELARRLSVSQAPVREAIKRLVHEGLVVSIPRRGSYVTAISPDEHQKARRVRARVEQVAAEALASSITPSQLEELAGIVRELHEAAAAGHRAQLRLADARFHGSVVRMSHSGLLERVWNIMEPSLLSQHVLGDPTYSGSLEEIATSHDVLLETLRAGDAEAASAAFHQHAMGSLS